MAKAQISERNLVEVINLALAKDWPYKDRPCRVEALKKVSHADRNCEVATDSTSGPDLRHVQECNTLRRRILDELAPKYDVIWS